MSPRHQLTPVERQRGHKLTREDRVQGGRNVPAEARRRGGQAAVRALNASGKAPRFTSESARLASLKRWALHRIYLAGPEKTFVEVARMGAQRAAAPSPRPRGLQHTVEDVVPQIDPFTLSALKRFRLGPVSPFHLTRSQRGHVDLMRAAGLIERTADDHLALTEKGRQAIGNETGNE